MSEELNHGKGMLSDELFEKDLENKEIEEYNK